MEIVAEEKEARSPHPGVRHVEEEELKIVYVDRIIEVPGETQFIERIREVERIVEKPVEVIVEKIVERPVEVVRIVDKIIEVPY